MNIMIDFEKFYIQFGGNGFDAGQFIYWSSNRSVFLFFIYIFFIPECRGCKTGQVFQTDSFILSDLDWRCSNDAYADHAGDAVLVSCVGIRIFDGTDFYVCIFILYVGDQKEWFPDQMCIRDSCRAM